MPVMIGGETAWKSYAIGDIALSFQWVNGEQAMALFPVQKKTASGVYVICLSAAFRYANPDYLVRQSAEAARHMGMDETVFTVRRIADAILNGMDDLGKMPPEPNWAKVIGSNSMGELSIQINGKSLGTHDLLVPDGVLE